MSRGPPRSWRKAIRSHIGKPAFFGNLSGRGSGWQEREYGLCYITRVIGREFDVSDPAAKILVSPESSIHDIIVEVLSESGLLQVRTSHRTAELLEPDGEVVWPRR